MNVYRTQDIVQQQNVLLRVNSPRKRYSSFLTSWKGNSFLTNLSILSFRQKFNVLLKRWIVQGLLEFFLVVWLRKGNVLFNCCRHYPGFLTGVGYWTVELNGIISLSFHLIKNRINEWGFAAADVANYHCKFSFFYLQVYVLKSL